ncbi:MAG: sigma-70 family RNA polymerase sigma factor [Planctomycetota bacterium]
MSDLDRSFERFCRTGCPTSLARVFDQAAPLLLLHALELVRRRGGDEAAAEDAVQETFLIAIERRRRCRHPDGALPWLRGILTNVVRQQRRREQRTAAPDQRPGHASLDPVGVATLRDLTQAVQTAITSLPEVYQPVITLHLRRGLRAHEIAAELGRSPGTVRTQLARGLRLLRAALPLGLGLALTARLPATRRRLVRVAKAAATPAAGTRTRWLRCAIAASLAGLATSAAWPRHTAAVPLLRRAAADPVPAAPTAVRWANTTRRRPIAAAAGAGPVVRGRCVAAESGRPLAQVEAILIAGATTLARARTDDRGVFHLAAPQRPAGSPLELRLRAPGRAEVRASGEAATHRLPRGFRWLGRVTDHGGAPIAGVELVATPCAGALANRAYRHRFTAITAAGGDYTSDALLAPGHWRVTARWDAHSLDRTFVVPEGGPPTTRVDVRFVEVANTTGMRLPCASLRVRCAVPEVGLVPLGARFGLRLAAADATGADGRLWEPDAHGIATLTDVPTGRTRLEWVAQIPGPLLFCAEYVSTLAEIEDLAPAASREIALCPAPREWGELRGHITLDHLPLGHRSVHVRGPLDDPRVSESLVAARTAAHGGFTLRVPTGRYEVFVDTPNGMHYAPRPCLVTPATNGVEHFALTSRRVDIELTTATGHPAPGYQVRLCSERPSWIAEAMTDERGRAAVPGGPRTSAGLWASARRGTDGPEHALGRCVVAPHAMSTLLRLRLP